MTESPFAFSPRLSSSSVRSYALGVGVVVFQTVFAKPAGQAAAYRQKESATNWIAAQATFEQEYADYGGYLAKIKTYAGPLSATQTTELEGLRQQCITVAQNYNADSRKYLLRDFKSADLPYSLEASPCAK